jgi:hypothetical protein
MDWQKSIADIDKEIEALQRVRQSMVEASGGEPVKRGVRTSSAGSDVIRWSAKKRWALKKGDKAALKEIEKNLALAKAALDADKATRRRR